VSLGLVIWRTRHLLQRHSEEGLELCCFLRDRRQSMDTIVTGSKPTSPLCRDDLHISNVDPATNIKFMCSKVIPTGDERNYKRTLSLPIHHLERKWRVNCWNLCGRHVVESPASDYITQKRVKSTAYFSAVIKDRISEFWPIINWNQNCQISPWISTLVTQNLVF